MEPLAFEKTFPKFRTFLAVMVVFLPRKENSHDRLDVHIEIEIKGSVFQPSTSVKVPDSGVPILHDLANRGHSQHGDHTCISRCRAARGPEAVTGLNISTEM